MVKNISRMLLVNAINAVTFCDVTLCFVKVWKDAFQLKQKAPYMTHLCEGSIVESLEFANFEDVLGVGHSMGFTSLLIPGILSCILI